MEARRMLRIFIFCALSTIARSATTRSIELSKRGSVKYSATLGGSKNEEPDKSNDDGPTTLSPERVDINKTVLEVERILNKYPELPRLDRSEILSLLQNITEADNEKLKEELIGVLEEEKENIQKSPAKEIKKWNTSRESGHRSVMVVLPFNAEEEKDSLEELYTKNPIVMMEEEKEVTTFSPSSFSSQPATEPLYSIIEKEDPKFNPPLRIIGYRYHTTAASSNSAEQSTRSYANFQDPDQVTMAFRTQEVPTGNAWNHKNADSSTEIDSEKKSMKPGTVLDDESPYQSSVYKEKGEFHVPENVDNFSIEDAMVDDSDGEVTTVKQMVARKMPTTTKVYVISDKISFTTPKIYVTSGDLNTTDAVYITSDSSPPLPTTTTTPKMYVTQEQESSFEKTTKTDWSRLKKTTTEKMITTEHTKKKYKPKTTEKSTKTAPQKVEVLQSVLDNLPPHMRDMLNNIGVNGEPTTNPTTTEYVPKPPMKGMAAEIDPSSYMQFKPLPVKKHKIVQDEMQSLLASYGLLDNVRQQKAVTQTTTPFNDKFLDSAPEINPDILTETMQKTLENLGLYNKTLGKASRNHIFNPSSGSSIQTDDEVKKLNALLTTIKKLASLNDNDPVTPEFQNEILQQVKDLDNITISYKSSAKINEEIHKIMEKNKGKFKIPIILQETSVSNTLQSGLDPEFFEDIQLKNEVKRQENSSTTTTTTTTTTEPANSPELEDSFGGGGVAPADSNPSDSLPPQRPNGLYFLLDWNTFFQVGTEDDKRRVNIRFQPKIGDGRNFLPVTIP